MPGVPCQLGGHPAAGRGLDAVVEVHRHGGATLENGGGFNLTSVQRFVRLLQTQDAFDESMHDKQVRTTLSLHYN